ncbi:MAG: ATP-binding cassette domain-containing protein, partial [Planctomycetaceae bacterium]
MAAMTASVHVQDVSFAYHRAYPVLKDISFRVEAGEKIAIVGATGSGKSTLINLLSRFYDVQKGEILIDGIDIRLLPLDLIRQSITVVLQDPFLFSGTIEENIRLWGRPLPDEQVQRAARQVHADAFIDRLPNRYQAPVAERGASLSVG